MGNTSFKCKVENTQEVKSEEYIIRHLSEKIGCTQSRKKGNLHTLGGGWGIHT